ncbi:MAG TPA: tetraacyldisaccharide 4'-kinase, partial [Burkholderiaceae bacterium]|nr:tetraacyldisaccharide 4'-kinase [Burkholderiaceae bacterium]
MRTSRSLQQRIEAAWAGRGALARCLWPLARLYGAVVALRRASHGLGLLRPERLPVPVVVVGNLVAGGAGKTPTVLAVVDLLRRRGFSPGVVSRGYGRAGDAVLEVEPDTPAGRCGDEPLLLRLRARVPVVVGRDR